MNINSNKKKLSIILNELSIKYLESLLVLVDIPIPDSKEKIIRALLKTLKNPIKLKNFFHNLSDFQKMVVSDVIYNLNGQYIENYMIAKYDKAPLFERKNILFTNNKYPNYLSLFIYQKTIIPIEIQKMLKKITPKPPIWEPQSFKKAKENINSLYNKYYFVYYVCLYSQINIIKTNKKNFNLIDESEQLLNKVIDTKGVPLILKLLFHSNLIEFKNRKIISSNNKLNLTDLLNTLLDTSINNKEFLYSFYKKRNLEFIKNIVKFRTIIKNSIFKIKPNLSFKLEEIYKFIEINNYNQKIDLPKTEKIKDLKLFLKNLSYLGVINFYSEDKEELISINQKQVNFLSQENYSIPLDINAEVILLENFEIIILDTLDLKNQLFLSTFTNKVSSKKYQIDKNKLLKLLNKGLSLNILINFLNNISNNEMPSSLSSYLEDLNTQKISINTENNILVANSLLIEILIHNKRFNKNITKLENNTIKYDKEIEKKLISYLTSLEYYIQRN